MQHVYGVLDSNNCHIDVSLSLLGAKQYATRHGYKQVSIRYNCGYNVDVVATKQANGKWKAEE